jgi:lactate dehydrogenase-like 2-hydroxyacid dehydrogenase
MRMSDHPVIFVAQPHLGRVMHLIPTGYEVLPLWDESSRPFRSEARALITAGEFRLSHDLLESMPKLGLIACFAVGYDGVDVDWARERGIAVSHAVDANADDVADHAIGLIIAHRRHILDGDRALRAGDWTPDSKIITRSLGGAVIGIVGMGSIGRGIAVRAAAMRMQVRWWGPRPKLEISWPREEDLLSLARASDILVVAARATAENENLISGEVIDALGPQGLLVNVARGQLVDEDALITALREGRLGGAALDVYRQEPTPIARWHDVPNVILTPHIAGATNTAVTRMMEMLVANLDAFFAGKPLVTPVP